MYAGGAKTVPLPKVGRCHILKNGYVYWEDDGKWNSEKKRTIDHRVSIGKLVEGSRDRLYPNKKYFELFDEEGRPKPKSTNALVPVKQENDDDKKSSKAGSKLPDPGIFSTVLTFGPWYVLTQAAEKIGCLPALKDVFPLQWKRIFALAIHSIVAEDSVAQDYSIWAFDNYTGLSKNLSSGEISDLYTAISNDPDAIRDFISKFHENYLKLYPNAGENPVAFDSTNQNTSSKEIEEAEYGHAKEDEGLPDINTALIVDQETGIPLYYEHFLGSLLDKVQAPDTVEKMESLGFTKLFFMMDRGYCSKKCADSMKEHFFGMMCMSSLKFVKTLIAKYASVIKDNEAYYISIEDIYGVMEPTVEAFGGMYRAFVYYDAFRAQDERDTIHIKIEGLMKTVLKRKRYTDGLKKRYGKWLVIEQLPQKDPQTGRDFTVKVNTDAVQKCIDEAGYFVILSNTKKSAEEMIRIARMRDRDEKAFRRIKNHFGLTKTYIHNSRTYEGKMFTAFVALIICESYRWYIKSYLSAVSSRTTHTSLGELKKYKITQFNHDGKWIPMYAVTRAQKDILKDIGKTAKEMETAARKVDLRV